LIIAADLPGQIQAWFKGSPSVEALLGLYASPIPHMSRLDSLDQLRQRFGEDPRTRLLTTVALIQDGRSEEALADLETLVAKPMLHTQEEHLAHLRAVCLLALGQTDQAHRVLRAAEKMRGKSCQLQSLRAILNALRASPRKLRRASRGHELHAFACRLRAADLALAQEDHSLVRHYLSDDIVPRSHHLQALARLAQLELSNVDSSDAFTPTRWQRYQGGTSNRRRQTVGKTSRRKRFLYSFHLQPFQVGSLKGRNCGSAAQHKRRLFVFTAELQISANELVRLNS
jgi:hypothetical protein